MIEGPPVYIIGEIDPEALALFIAEHYALKAKVIVLEEVIEQFCIDAEVRTKT